MLAPFLAGMILGIGMTLAAIFLFIGWLGHLDTPDNSSDDRADGLTGVDDPYLAGQASQYWDGDGRSFASPDSAKSGD